MKKLSIVTLISILQFVALHAQGITEEMLVFITTPTLADGAQDYCVREFGGNLVSIHSEAKNTIITNLCQNLGQTQESCWLGMSNAVIPTHWYDGTPINYTAWGLNEPDATGSQNCVTIRGPGAGGGIGQWFTVGYCATDGLPFICQFDVESVGSTLYPSLYPEISVYPPLFVGQALVSDSGRYFALLQKDGNFVIYDETTAEAVWATGSGGYPHNDTGRYLTLQGTDGNIVLYTGYDFPTWASNTFPFSPSRLVLEEDPEDNANLVAYDESGVAYWDILGYAPFSTYYGCVSTDNATNPFVLAPGDVLYSDDGNVRLDMQASDGNLCLYTFDGATGTWTYRWCSFATGTGNYAVLEITGNLVVYNVSNQEVWRAPETLLVLPPFEPVTLCVDDCGKAFIYDFGGIQLWESNYTGGSSLGYPINDCSDAALQGTIYENAGPITGVVGGNLLTRVDLTDEMTITLDVIEPTTLSKAAWYNVFNIGNAQNSNIPGIQFNGGDGIVFKQGYYARACWSANSYLTSSFQREINKTYSITIYWSPTKLWIDINGELQMDCTTDYWSPEIIVDVTALNQSVYAIGAPWQGTPDIVITNLVIARGDQRPPFIERTPSPTFPGIIYEDEGPIFHPTNINNYGVPYIPPAVINITNEMTITLDVTESNPLSQASWYTVFKIGNCQYCNYPLVSFNGGNGVVFQHNDYTACYSGSQYFTSSFQRESNKTYSITIYLSPIKFWIAIDGEVELDCDTQGVDAAASDQIVYAVGSPWQTTPDINITNLVIAEGDQRPPTSEPTTAAPTTAEPTTAEPTPMPTETYSGCVTANNFSDPFILYPGDVLYSDTGDVRLIMQDDGNLCLYTADGSTGSWTFRWCSYALGKGNYAVLETGFDVYDAYGTLFWSANLTDSIVPIPQLMTLCVDDCGKAFIYDMGFEQRWESEYENGPSLGFPIDDCIDAAAPTPQPTTAQPTSAPTENYFGCVTPIDIANPFILYPGDILYSDDFDVRLVMQANDGNLCLYTGDLFTGLWDFRWCTMVLGVGNYAVLDTDLVVYNASDDPVWFANQTFTGIPLPEPVTLCIDNCGKAFLYSIGGLRVWETPYTNGPSLGYPFNDCKNATAPTFEEYIFVSTPAPLYEAAANCQDIYQGDIVSIHSELENALVTDACQSAFCLIGLDNSAPLTSWMDGTAIDYTSWYPGEPDGTGSAQPYVQIRGAPGSAPGTWHTMGELAGPYICKGTPTSSPTPAPTGEYTGCKTTYSDGDPFTLYPGDMLYSDDMDVRLIMQEDDGNLCLYTADGATGNWTYRWCSFALGIGNFAVLDNFAGNLIVYDSNDEPIWNATGEPWPASILPPYPPITLCVDDCGKAFLYGFYSGERLWESNYTGGASLGYPVDDCSDAAAPTPQPTTAQPTAAFIVTYSGCVIIEGEDNPLILYPGEAVYSNDLDVRFIMQETDGNLCLYTLENLRWTYKWCTFELAVGNYATVDIFGDLIVYNVSDDKVYEKGPSTYLPLPPYEPVSFCVDNCGAVFLYDVDGIPLWNISASSADCSGATAPPEPTPEPTAPEQGDGVNQVSILFGLFGGAVLALVKI